MTLVLGDKKMNLISEDYLMHYGVKGMKWGVRHDPVREAKNRRKQGYTDQEIKQKRKQLMDASPKNNGSRRSTSAPPTKGYWRNAPKSTIKRAIYNDELREAKRQKSVSKYVNKAQSKSSYAKNLSDSIRKYGDWEDDEFLDLLSPSERKAEWDRSMKVADMHLRESKYWDRAVKSISITKNRKEAKSVYNRYKDLYSYNDFYK